MAVTQYIGARYVPLIDGTWNIDNEYEPLTVVLYQGNSYTSRQAVPAGIDITNAEYWALTGNYNAQVEQYRTEVAQFSDRITDAQETADGATVAVQTLNGELTAEVSAREAADTQLRADFTQDLADEVSALNATISADVDRLELQDEGLSQRIDASNANLNPIYLGSWALKASDGLGVMHIGGMCDVGDYQVVLASPVAVDTANRGYAYFIDIKNNYREVKPRKTLTIGHAQSIAYVPEIEKFFVVPLFDYSSGSAQQISYYHVFNKDFTEVQTFNAPSVIQNFAYDKVTHKLYAMMHSNYHLWQVDYTQSEPTFTRLANLQNPRYHSQGFAVYNDMWVTTNPYRGICFGTLGAENKALTYGHVNVYDSWIGYRVLGELCSCDFSPDGNLLACGDVIFNTSAQYNRAATVFEIPVPWVKQCYLEPYVLTQDRQVASLAGNNITLNDTITANNVTWKHLRQLSTMETVELASLMHLSYGPNVRFTLAKDYGSNTENINLTRFANVSFRLATFSLNANLMLSSAGNIAIENGTYNVRKLNNYFKTPSVTMNRITFGSNVDNNMFVDNDDANTQNAGLTLALGGLIDNPNNVTFRGKVLATGDVIIAGKNLLTN